MKLRLLLFGLLLSCVVPLFSQDEEVDVTTLLADTKTFIFNNNRSTVKGYIFAELQAKTSCCGTDRIYLEVKIDPSGYVLHAKTLTGRNDCFMKSAVDIVKNIKWNTEDFKGGPRSVYFEIKPDIACEGRANAYVEVPVFNNELINTDGSVTASPRPAPAKPEPQPTPQAPQTQPAPQTQQPTPAPTEPAPAVAATPKPATPEVSVGEPSTPQPKPATKPQPTAQEDDPVVIETPERLTESSGTKPGTLPRREEPAKAPLAGKPTPQEPVAAKELTEEEKKAQAREEAERQRRDDEIRKLKEEMARMRASEEKVREQRMAQERRQREEQRNDPFASSGSDRSGARGGLFLDDLPYEGEDSPTDPPKGGTPAGQQDPGANEDERIRNDIARMEQRIRELEQGNRDVESDIRRRMQDAEKANREIIELAEQKARREEEAAQLREQRELDRIAENRRKIEEDQNRQQSEVQRLQDELARLQGEMQTRMMDLEKQKTEIDRIAVERQQREQEIMLTRALREKETEVELERLRLEKLNSNMFASATPSGRVNANALMTDFATAADSEKYEMLLTQIVALQQEVNFLRQQLGQDPLQSQKQSSSRDSSPTVDRRNTSTQPGSKPASTPPGSRRADQIKDWENIDIVAPGLTPQDYQVVPRPSPQPTTQTTSPSRPGSTPDAQASTSRPADKPAPTGHVSTHANTEGPKLQERTYANGESALKELVAKELKKGGVCGPAHVYYSVTLRPDGTVVNYRVLSSNTTLVNALMGTIIPNLKYNAIDARYNQTVYQEIRADINCEGSARGDVRSVPRN